MSDRPSAGRPPGAGQESLRQSLSAVSALLLSVALLLAGNGLQGTLIPIRAYTEDFGAFELGLLGTAYFAGFTAGCIQGPALVRRGGHIRTFMAMTSLVSAVVLVHPLIVEPNVWWVLRAVTGFCFAVLYIVIESWLNERATNEMRGTVFSVYTVITLTVMAIGQILIGTADPNSFALFAVASVVVSLAALPIAFTAAASPVAIDLVKPRLAKLGQVSPVGVAGCFAVGLANGAFWALGPVYAQDLGLDTAGIGFFMSAAVLGGALGQWPLGRLSDRMDRRIVIVAASCVAIAAATLLTLFQDHDATSMILVAALFGAGAFPVYPLSVAHANDYARPSEFVEVSSGLLLVFGIGAAVGPLLASLARELRESPALFLFTSIVHAVLVIYVLWRMTRRVAADPDDRVEFSDAVIAAQTVSSYPLPDDAASAASMPVSIDKHR